MKRKRGGGAVLIGAALWAGMFFVIRAHAEPSQDSFALNLNNPSVRAALKAHGAQVVDEGPDGGPCVKITVPATAEGTSAPNPMVSFPLDIGPFRGDKIAIVAKIRSQDVTEPAHRYAGIKAQVQIDSPVVGKVYIDQQNFHGTFDWREISAIGIIPADATRANLALGLQECTGTVWFSDIRVRTVEKAAPRPAPVASLDQKEVQYRGVMSPGHFDGQDFKDMKAWHINCVRWHFSFYMMKGQEADPAVYEAWLNDRLDELQQALDAAQENGIKVVIDVHQPPGGRIDDGTVAMLLDRKLEDAFVADWERIARRFKDHPALWAYDLINEPVQNQVSPEGVDDWFQVQVRAAQAVRAIDPRTAIMFEVDGWDGPASYALMQPIDVSNIIYQVHMYWPATFTHQGVHTNQGIAKDRNTDAATIRYPGLIGGMNVDKEALRAQLQPVRDFQKAYNVRIYVGEFSAIRWAPGAAQYLDDLISIFEEYDWDWTYHAFRESPGWSVEHADLPYDRNYNPKATEPTDRQLVLQKWLLLNAPSAEGAPKSP